ncbi:MAG: malto-oligosyltrehalose trehalohydrolase [Verrucomicrobia bacterium]|nr:malto-oligosyltrehalose trehalohydrolase [Verrucomicrobiota bacterium]
MTERRRRYPIGAELIAPNETHFRVWAPKLRTLEVVIGTEVHPLAREEAGYFSCAVKCGADARYKFRVNGGDAFPDPASRYQPDGPHGASCVVDPFAFRWTDESWPGIQLPGQIIYEFHVGTFTPEGTWRAAMKKLPLLKESGITLLEMMPIADFPGRFGWGYDGVDLFAPTRLYGAPDDLRAFVNEAHALGLGVILDVVYNHFGPDGNYLGQYSDDYLNRDNANEWGDAINFDGKNSGPVREFFITNGRYWIEEFHLDGFRFDATQSIHDRSEEYVVGAIGRAAREAAGSRNIVLIAENEPQETKLVRPRSEGGDDLDALWNDDWHHSAIVALTGRNEAYLSDYRGKPQEFISAAKYGYLYQGQPYSWQEAPRGFPAFGIPPQAFVAFLENHDQVSNFAMGDRVRSLTSPGEYRAMTALLLLGPWTPLLFQGEEFGATAPFCYFADVGDAKLKEAIRKGRFEFLAQFPSAASAESQSLLPIPHDERTFQNSKLDWSEAARNSEAVKLHRDLIQLRREDSRFRRQIARGVDGAVLGSECFVLRFLSDENDDRLLVVNLGCRSELSPASEPLLAPPLGTEWELIWTSDSPEYGGSGRVDIVPDEGWLLPAQAAVVFCPRVRKKPRKKPKKR